MDVCPISKKICEKEKRHQVTETINGEVKMYYLCDDCAASFFTDKRTFAKVPNQNVLDKLLELLKNPLSKKCPNCGLSLSEICKSGKLGCVKCRECFGPKIIEKLRQN